MKRYVSILLALILLLSLTVPAAGAEGEAAPELPVNPPTAGSAVPEEEAELMASVTRTVNCRQRLHVAATKSNPAELYFSATTTNKSGHCYNTAVDITVDGYVTLSDRSLRYFFTARHDSDDTMYTYYMPSYTFVTVTDIYHTFGSAAGAHPHARSCDCGYSEYTTSSSCLQCYPGTVKFYASGATNCPSNLTNLTSSTWTVPAAIPAMFPKVFNGWSTSSGSSSGSYSPGSSYSISAKQTISLYAAWKTAAVFPAGADEGQVSGSIPYKNSVGYWSFVPDEDAVYAFDSQSARDTLGSLYTAGGSLLATDDNSGDDSNFLVSAPMTAGQTYYLRGSYVSASVSGALTVRMRRQYTVSFDPNGGEGAPESFTKLHGEEAVIPDFIPSPGEAEVALAFSGWAVDPEAVEAEYVPGDAYTADADATLYAVWSDPAGECGENLRWTVSGNTLTISGSGDMADYTPDAPAPWTPYAEKITALVVGPEVTGIGDCAFLALTLLPSAALPENLERIGSSAFSGCAALTAVTGLEGVARIGDHAFFDCAALAFDALELTCVSLGAGAFSGCTGIRSVSLTGTETIGEAAFERCSTLRTVTLPAGLKVLPAHVFDSDTQLGEVILPAGLEQIGAGAFSGCASLPALTVPAGVTAIGAGAFHSCAGLREITIPDTVTDLGAGLFAYVQDLVTVKCWLDTPIHNYCKDNDIAFQLLPWGVLDAPVFTAAPVSGGVSVTITAPRGQIRYTLDGSEPTAESPLYESPLEFRKNGSIRARAFAEGWTESPVAVYETALQRAAAPRGSFPSGSVLAPGTSVALSCDTPDARILYTTNGDLPTAADLYTDPFVLTESTVVYAMAVKDGMISSPLSTLSYTVSDQTDVPLVNTLAATEITDTGASLHASLEEGSEASLVQFVYYEKNNSALKYTVTAGAGMSAALSGLLPDTEYWYMAKAANDAGWGSGAILSFRTDAAESQRPQSITLNTAYTALNVGRRTTLVATVLPSSADTRQVFWTSSDPGVATVDRDGVVTAVGPGNADITATTVSGRLTAVCRVDVLSSSLNGSFDFSELNMAANSSSYDPCGYDHGPSDGGNALMASAYLARWDGVVAETSDPYPASGKPEDVRFHELEAEYHVQNILYLPYRSGPLDNDDIKNALVKWGAVYTALKINYRYFNEAQSAYFLPENVKNYNGGHAVVIVGWDDDYPAANFFVPPAGNGAFLCKNSWGTGSGEDGYFWVSYYDKTLARESCGDYNAVFCDLQSRDNYDKIYQYDYPGPVTAVTPGGRSVYAANVFPEAGAALAQDEELRAVSFYTYAPGTLYEIYVVTEYTDATSLANLGAPVCSGALDYAGYFTVDLPAPLALRAGTRFAVAVKFTAVSGDAALFVELPTTMTVGNRTVDHSSNARANPGESFLSRTGKSWTDYTDLTSNANLCIKAFTDCGDEEPASLQGVDDSAREWVSDRVYTPEELLAMGYLLNPAVTGGDALLLEDEEGEEDTFFGLSAPSILPDLNTTYSVAEGSSLPRRYDLREEGCVTPVKDQGEIGSCWCFATCASLESAALKAAAGASTHSADGLSCASPLASSLELDEAVSLVVGSEQQLLPRLSPVDLQPEFLWRSDDPTVATVSAYGLVTAVGTGTARITAVLAADQTVKALCSVTVSEPKPLRGIYIVDNETDMEIGEAQLLSFDLFPSSAASAEVIWSSSDPAVAEVDRYGVLTAKAAGMAEITVRVAGGSLSDTFTLVVADERDYAVYTESSTLSLSGGSLTGGLTLRVKAPADASGPCSLILAFYDGSGRLLQALPARGELADGACRVELTGISVPAPKAGSARMKVFLLSGTEIPLAEPLESTLG